jgi:hypothetical protein
MLFPERSLPSQLVPGVTMVMIVEQFDRINRWNYLTKFGSQHLWVSRGLSLPVLPSGTLELKP